MPFSPSELAEQYRKLGGSFYAYDLDSMLAHLRGLQTEGLRLWYACKANPLSAVLETVKEAGFSFDVASLGELDQVLRLGVDGKNLLLTGPVKSDAFLDRAFAAGVEWFVVESQAQLLRVEKLAAASGKYVNALIRLQLSWENSAGSVLGGSKVTPFGMGPEDWGPLPETSHVKVRGVHVFQWGNVLSVKDLGGIWSRIADEAREFADVQDFSLDVLDLGGGIGISYSDPSVSFPWEEARNLLKDVRARSGASELWMELGRYAVGPFGVYVTPIVERKSVRGEEFLLCTGGAHHMVRPALVGESFPVEILGGAAGELRLFRVHGPLCTALDHLGSYQLPSEVREGDLLLFRQAGAYGFTESMPFFLCHELAAEVVFQGGEFKVLRSVESPESWMR